MKDNNLNVFNKIIIATVLLLVIVVIYFQQTSNEDVLDGQVETVTSQDNSPILRLEAPVSGKIDPKKMTIPYITKKYKESIGFNAGRYDYIMKQKVLVKEFKNKIKLEVNLPVNMHFTEIDMEDNIAGLYGSSHDQEKQMAILATEGKVKMSDVIEYLKDAGKALPLLNSHEIQGNKIQTIPAPESTGLSDLKIIPTTEVNGKSTYAAVGERKDGKGTYLFIMEAPTVYFEEKEGSLDLMLESIKTKP